MSNKSLQSQINELKRTVEKYHVQHKLLKSKVTELARRLRAIEPFVYVKDRESFVDLMEVFLEFARELTGKGRDE